jgi:hypothetical protein
MTRWVTDDLAGRLRERDGDAAEGGKWHVLKLPILNSHGESLWPEMYPVEEIEDMRNGMGESAFQALYMQEPVDAIERMFSDPKFSEPPARYGPLRIWTLHLAVPIFPRSPRGVSIRMMIKTMMKSFYI